jgi:hypothetical protein
MVNKFREAEVAGQMLLRYAPMRSESSAQQRPQPFDRIDVHVMKAVTIVISRILTAEMANPLVRIAPCLQTSIDVIRISEDASAQCDGGLLDIRQHPHGNISTAGHHAENRRLLSRQRPSATCPLEMVPSSSLACYWTASGGPLCAAIGDISSGFLHRKGAWCFSPVFPCQSMRSWLACEPWSS